MNDRSKIVSLYEFVRMPSTQDKFDPRALLAMIDRFQMREEKTLEEWEDIALLESKKTT